MNDSGQILFLDAAMVLCAVMALVNLARTKSRGNSAYFLSGAFLLFGASIYAYLAHAPLWICYLGGSLVFGLLVADVLYRAGGRK